MNCIQLIIKKGIIALFLFCFLPVLLPAQPALQNVYNRKTSSLNGQWHYIVDPYETGYYNYRYQPYDVVDKASTSAFYNNYHAKNKQELVEYDFNRSPKMQVPGDWNSQKENLFYYEGTIWLKRSFQYPLLKKGSRLLLHFGAVNYRAEVYLNGHKLGIHEGGFTSFDFDVTPYLNTDSNFLVVKADNRRIKDGVPGINTDWFNYGGITRDVTLVETPDIYIRDYALQLARGNAHKIAGYVQLNRFASNSPVQVDIPELGVRTQFATDSTGRAAFEIDVDSIRYWSTEQPVLYNCTIRTNREELKDRIGFRTIETAGQDILLNGKPVLLKGISMHEENSAKGSRANSRAEAVESLSRAKQLGCNYVRLAHYPHNEYMVQVADSMGMMVWDEIPVYWTIDFSNPRVLRNAAAQLSEMISRDKNRASVIIWSVANETPPTSERNYFLLQLIRQARLQDATRLVSAALEQHTGNSGVHMVNDSIGQHLDIVAFNQYTGWYGGSLKDAPNMKWEIGYHKPVVISEFGGDAKYGLHGTKEERWTEEYQEYLYEQNLKMIMKIPGVRGMSPWILADFRSPKRLLPGVQDGWNRKGLLTGDGKKKKAYFTLRNFYTNWTFKN
ncbi:MAG: glycoside hydrolase family 2 TIM barrel-domain containing protein [Sediminibacterium sp.]